MFDSLFWAFWAYDFLISVVRLTIDGIDFNLRLWRIMRWRLHTIGRKCRLTIHFLLFWHPYSDRFGTRNNKLILSPILVKVLLLVNDRLRRCDVFLRVSHSTRLTSSSPGWTSSTKLILNLLRLHSSSKNCRRSFHVRAWISEIIGITRVFNLGIILCVNIRAGFFDISCSPFLRYLWLIHQVIEIIVEAFLLWIYTISGPRSLLCISPNSCSRWVQGVPLDWLRISNVFFLFFIKI